MKSEQYEISEQKKREKKKRGVLKSFKKRGVLKSSQLKPIFQISILKFDD